MNPIPGFGEWGTEFPISGNIPALLQAISHSFKPITCFSRTLNAIAYLFDDSSFLIIPIRTLQSSKSCQELLTFINDDTQPLPKSVFYKKKQNPDDPSIVTLTAYNHKDSYPFFIIIRDNFTYDIYAVATDGVQMKMAGVSLNIKGQHGSKLTIAKVQNSIISIVIRAPNETTVYCARFQLSAPICDWSQQCKLDDPDSDIIILQPSIYVFNEKKLSGCALDSAGLRRFPRPLTTVIEREHLKIIKTLNDLFVLDLDSGEIIRVTGKNIKTISVIPTVNVIDVFALGNRIFTLTNTEIKAYDFVSGEKVNENKVSTGSKWLISLEESFGVVIIGDKCYSLSRTELSPMINLYDEESEVLRQLRHAKDSAGTVTAPILIMANRSPYLAATIMKDEIEHEIDQNFTDGTLQAHVRPTLIKLFDLLSNKPEC